MADRPVDFADTDASRTSGLADRSQFSLRHFTGNTYECRALICPEPEGGFSAFALRLPGVASQGETIEEAVTNLAEAFQGTLLTYLDSGLPIPWEDLEIDRTDLFLERWVLVNV